MGVYVTSVSLALEKLLKHARQHSETTLTQTLTKVAILVDISERGDGTSIPAEQVRSSECDWRGEEKHVLLQIQVHTAHLTRFTLKLTVHVEWSSN